MARKIEQTAVSDFVKDTAKEDRAAALAFFLLDNTGSVLGTWRGTMSIADQRALFGFVIGKGVLTISGEYETVAHSVQVCFGTMSDTVFSPTWADLCSKQYNDYPHIHRY